MTVRSRRNSRSSLNRALIDTDDSKMLSDSDEKIESHQNLQLQHTQPKLEWEGEQEQEAQQQQHNDINDRSNQDPTKRDLLYRYFSILARHPARFALLFILPSLVAIALLFVPKGWSLKLDFTYDQFRIQGDPVTVKDDSNSALRSASFATYKPPDQQLEQPNSSANPMSHTSDESSFSFQQTLTQSINIPAILDVEIISSHASFDDETVIENGVAKTNSQTPSRFSRFSLSSIVDDPHPVAETLGHNVSLHSFHTTNDYIHRAYAGETLTIIYTTNKSSKGKNLLTSTMIRRIRTIENALMAMPAYQKYCRVYYTGTDQGKCIVPNSVLNFMYPSVNSADQSIRFDGKGSILVDPHEVTRALMNQGLSGFFDRDCSAKSPQSASLISSFTFGLPIEGYQSVSDRLGEQRAFLRRLLRDFDAKLRQFDSTANQQGFLILREGGEIVQSEVESILARDLITVSLSIALVFAYMWLHTRSLFLTLNCLMLMALAFPPVILAFEWTFGHYMSLMNIVAVWLLLAIGTDDCFIFVDTWNQWSKRDEMERMLIATRKNQPSITSSMSNEEVVITEDANLKLNLDDLTKQLDWTTRRAASAMLVTSFTTAVGFLSTAVSPLAPIKQFGFFLGFLIVVNYLLVITFLPAVVVIYEKRFAKMKYLKCFDNPRFSSFLGRLRSWTRIRNWFIQPSSLSVGQSVEQEQGKGSWELNDLSGDQATELALFKSPVFRNHRSLKDNTDLKQNLLDGEEKKSDQLVVDYSSHRSSVENRNESTLRKAWSLVTSKIGRGHVAGQQDSSEEPVKHGFSVRAMLLYARAVHRFRWLILLLTLVGVVVLATSIPELKLPDQLPQILPLDSNVEMLRAMRRQLICDRCVHGSLTQEANTPPPTCSYQQCTNPDQFEGCENIDCGEHGRCRKGSCICEGGWFGDGCSHKDHCYGHDCGSHGDCVTDKGTCQCRDGWSGESCSVSPVCQFVNCGDHGECVQSTGVCQCWDGFSGDRCQQSPPAGPPRNSSERQPISPDLAVNVLFIFGVESVDMSDADNENPGIARFDRGFDMSVPNTQLALVNLCESLQNNSRVRTELFRCAPLAFKQWVTARKVDFPVESSAFTQWFLAFVRGNSAYNSDVGFQTFQMNNDTGSYSYNRVSFVRVSVRTFIDADTSGMDLESEFDYWDSWFEQWMIYAPQELRSGFQTSPSWPRMRTELAFISGTLQSLAISISIVAVSMLIFTGNLIVVAATCVCIMGVVACLLGLFVAWDWPLGALEAISVPLVVGLSVDYCLHIGHAYMTSAHSPFSEREPSGSVIQSLDEMVNNPVKPLDRVSRARAALLVIGPSVIAAAITAIACLLVLLACRIVVFTRFGIIVATTLSLGLLMSMGTFVAILMVCGPQGNQGDISWIARSFSRSLQKAFLWAKQVLFPSDAAAAVVPFVPFNGSSTFQTKHPEIEMK